MDKIVYVGIGSAATLAGFCVYNQLNKTSSPPSVEEKKKKNQFVLYVYDHCPFCIRSRMIFGLKKIPFRIEFLANDDEETPISLVGKKMVPILTSTDGVVMPESMDIVKYIDEYDHAPILAPSANREDLKTWVAESAPTLRKLYHPRFHVAHLFPEFAKFESREYYRIKKEKSLGCSMEECLQQTPYLVSAANNHLAKLADLMKSDHFINESLSYDDIDIFGRLRGLTLVKDLKWPPKLRKYIDHWSQECDIPLCDAMATL